MRRRGSRPGPSPPADENAGLHPSRQFSPTVHGPPGRSLPFIRRLRASAGVDRMARDVDTVAAVAVPSEVLDHDVSLPFPRPRTIGLVHEAGRAGGSSSPWPRPSARWRGPDVVPEMRVATTATPPAATSAMPTAARAWRLPPTRRAPAQRAARRGLSAPRPAARLPAPTASRARRARSASPVSARRRPSIPDRRRTARRRATAATARHASPVPVKPAAAPPVRALSTAATAATDCSAGQACVAGSCTRAQQHVQVLQRVRQRKGLRRRPVPRELRGHALRGGLHVRQDRVQADPRRHAHLHDRPAVRRSHPAVCRRLLREGMRDRSRVWNRPVLRSGRVRPRHAASPELHRRLAVWRQRRAAGVSRRLLQVHVHHRAGRRVLQDDRQPHRLLREGQRLPHFG